MTLADLQALNVPALWAALTPEQKDAIGTAAVAQEFARLVAEDDGDDTTRDDRQTAEVMAAEAQARIAYAIEQAFPSIEWWIE